MRSACLVSLCVLGGHASAPPRAPARSSVRMMWVGFPSNVRQTTPNQQFAAGATGWTVGLLTGGPFLGSAIGSEPARAAAKALAPSLSPAQRFELERFVEGWQYGAGLDYKPPTKPTPMDPDALATAKRAAARARAYEPAVADVAPLAS